MVKPATVPPYAGLPVTSSNEAPFNTSKTSAKTEIGALRAQVEQLPAQLRTVSQQKRAFAPVRNFSNNVNQNIAQDGRVKCNKCGRPGHIARFCMSKPRQTSNRFDLNQRFDNTDPMNLGQSMLTTQDRFTQPMLVPDNQFPQSLAYGLVIHTQPSVQDVLPQKQLPTVMSGSNSSQPLGNFSSISQY